MTSAEFDVWREASIRGYCVDRARARGTSVDDEVGPATRVFDENLPDGPRTAGSPVLVVLDDEGGRVGVLWLGPHPTDADGVWIYDIAIDEEHRGRGRGRAAMLAAEQIAAQLGATVIGLNVFGFNTPARRLYGSLGYEDVSLQMRKQL